LTEGSLNYVQKHVPLVSLQLSNHKDKFIIYQSSNA